MLLGRYQCIESWLYERWIPIAPEDWVLRDLWYRWLMAPHNLVLLHCWPLLEQLLSSFYYCEAYLWSFVSIKTNESVEIPNEWAKEKKDGHRTRYKQIIMKKLQIKKLLSSTRKGSGKILLPLIFNNSFIIHSLLINHFIFVYPNTSNVLV